MEAKDRGVPVPQRTPRSRLRWSLGVGAADKPGFVANAAGDPICAAVPPHQNAIDCRAGLFRIRFAQQTQTKA